MKVLHWKALLHVQSRMNSDKMLVTIYSVFLYLLRIFEI